MPKRAKDGGSESSKQRGEPGRSRGANRVKGDLVEDIVALLYEKEGVQVQTRVPLLPLDDPTRQREFDVLVTQEVGGAPIRIAIECKNYAGPIGIEKIDAFIGKLADVGIPPEHGIFVAVNGYESGATKRAKKAGIRTLRLGGLTADRLQAEIHEALQAFVYLLLDIPRLTVSSDAENGEAWKLPLFVDERGKLRGTLIDLVWAKWRDGLIPYDLGEVELPLEIPPSWSWGAGAITTTNSATATARIIGLVMTDRGKAVRYTLKDADTGEVERLRVDTSFDTEASDSASQKTLPVEAAFTEEELQAILNRPAVARVVVGRMPLPRIKLGGLYWPPSQRSVQFMDDVFRQRVRRALERWWQFRLPIEDEHLFARPEVFNSLTQVEGTDLNTVWEPVMESHPSVSNPNWPFSDG